MTIRTFWTLFLKILGIWLILSGLSIIPQFVSAIVFFGNNQTENIYGIIYISALLLVIAVLYIAILQLFVFKTNWIIDKLKLDKGFQEETIDLSLKLQTVLTIATIVIGGLIFVDGFPMLCKQLIAFFQQKSVFREDPEFSGLILYSVKTFIGYLLMTNSKTVIKFFNKETDKNDN